MPQALGVYDHILKLGEGIHPDIAGRRAQDYLRNFEWSLAGTAAGGICPINLISKPSHTVSWPPKNRDQLKVLLRICQSACYFIVLLSSGSRASEVLSAKTDCLTESRQGIPLINGRTYKLEALFEGAKRDWPMPAVAVQAVQYQIELTKLLDRSKINVERVVQGPKGLWRVFTGKGQGNELRKR
jgi:integrase